ncbi:hypothetical protein UT300007_27430 [Clostridium sp. CTA-7]
MKKVFEDEFMDLQSEFVSLCLELTGNTVDNIYIYISIEEKSKMFNAFFKVGKELKNLNQLDINNSSIMKFLKLGTEDIERIKKLCNDYTMPIPSEMKMYYEVNTGKYNVDCKYESICSVKTGISAREIFMNWFMENK